MTTYWEKLKDPRWQKKRLEILERDGFQCQFCGDSESTLHVHHGYYAKGREPWEYENESLQTLCETCHEWEQELLHETRQAVGLLLGRTGYDVRSVLPQLIQAIGEICQQAKSEAGLGTAGGLFVSVLSKMFSPAAFNKIAGCFRQAWIQERADIDQLNWDISIGAGVGA